MADDLKTMSGFVMGLLDRMDEEDEKYKGLIPGTNIPSVMSQFQDIPQGPQMVPDSPQLFRSQMTVPELEQFKVPKKSTPPIVPVPEKPYEGSKQYVQDYFSRNQSRLPDRDPVPPTVYTLDEGIPIPAYSADAPKTQLSMEVPTFQGPVPEPYQDAGEYMRNYFSRNQGNLEDAREESRLRKERKSMLRSDGTMKDQTGFLGPIPTDDGRVMTEQTIGVEIDGKEVNIPALVPGLDEYEIGLLASGNVDWNSIVGKGIQEKAVNHYKFRKSRGLDPYYKEGEVAPPYYLANRGSRIPEGILPEFGTFRDPSEYIPKPNIPEEKTGFSKFFSFGGGSKLDSERLTNESFIQPKQDIEGLMSKQAEEDLSDRKDLVSGDLTVRQYEKNKAKREEELADAREKQAIHERQTLGMLNQRADQLEAAGLTDEANQVRGQIPKPDGDGIPKKDDGIPKKDDPAMQASTDSNVQVTQVTQKDVKEAPSKLTTDTKTLVDQNLDNANLNGDGTGGDGKGGDGKGGDGKGGKGDPEPGFFKSIWNAIKDIAKDGFEDPSLRKALFAYTASRVLGYDGVTLAASVLENEWQKQADQAKADRELEIAVGKKQAEAIKDQRMDYTTSKTMYDPRAKKNYSGFMNKTGDFEFAEEVILPYPNDKDEMVMTRFPAGSTLPVTFLTKLGYSVGEGDTLQDITSSYSKFAKDQAKIYLDNYYDTPKFTKLKEPQREAIKAQADNLFDDNAINEVISVVRSTLPAGSFEKGNSDFNSALDQGMRDAVNAIASGRSVDNAYLSAAIIEKKLTLDKDIKIKPYDFKFNPNIEQFKDYKDSKIGLNSLTRVMFGLKSPAADLGVDEFKILSHLSQKYSNLDPKMKDEYISFAVNSLEDDNATQEAVTPFMSYVLKKLDDDNLSATLKDLRDHFKSK